jgi:hypothetical protein
MVGKIAKSGIPNEQVAAGEVADGELVAVTLIGEHELALTVGASQIVG